ncbi:MAG: ADP-ribosyltransferase [Oligoflexales bacterium]
MRRLVFRALVLSTVALFACKPRQEGRSGLASSKPPTSGERHGKQADSRVFLTSQNADQTLAVKIFRFLLDATNTHPELVGCKEVPGAMPTKECSTYDPATRSDFIYCFGQSDTDIHFDIAKLDNVNCSFTSSSWPKVSSYLATAVLPPLLAPAASGGSVVIGGKRKLACSNTRDSWECNYEGFEDSVRDFLAERLVVRPDDFGSLTPPPGAKDEHGRPLPSSSQVSAVHVGMEAIVARTYKGNDGDLQRFMGYLPDEEEAEMKAHIEDVNYHSHCQEAEVFSLLDYSSEGYRDINKGLRTFDVTPAAIEPQLDGRIRTTISAVNCAKKIRAGVVVRGATLSPEKLARYIPGAFITEPAFTSTTVGTDVHSSFAGNVEFQYFDAKGADLTNLSLLNEEGEAELLFQAGTLFKVLTREQEENLTIIKLIPIP